jgi:spore germination cell wall hydrolase CwlJ-like protein
MKSILFALLLLPSIAIGCDRASQQQMLAMTMYHEARGEGLVGMQMVGEVVLNRVESIDFPNTVCAVVDQPGQFTYSRATPREQRSWQLARSLASRLLDGDYYPKNAAALYFNPGLTNLTFLRQHKNHSFYM